MIFLTTLFFSYINPEDLFSYSSRPLPMRHPIFKRRLCLLFLLYKFAYCFSLVPTQPHGQISKSYARCASHSSLSSSGINQVAHNFFLSRILFALASLTRVLQMAQPICSFVPSNNMQRHHRSACI